MTDQATPAHPATCTQADFARILERGRSYVTALKQEGRLVMTDGNLVDVAASLERIKATTGAPERAAAPVQGRTYSDAQDRERHYNAELRRLEFEKEVGKALDASQVEDVLTDILTTLRTRLEAWPDVLTPQIVSFAGAAGPTRALLAEHVEQQLAELARGFATAAKTKA